MKKNVFRLLCFFTIAAFFSCTKAEKETPLSTYAFRYADSVLYRRSQPADYVVLPVQQRSGTYSGFPEGIEIDSKTGAINVSKSESGLRYRIDFTADNGETYSTKVVISGINYADNYFLLSAHDTLVQPIYNADETKPLPTQGSVFDDGSLARQSGCAVGTVDGKINLAASIRNGLFGQPARNGAAAEVETWYRLNDGSNKALNGLKVKFYYYNSRSDVPQDLVDLLNDRRGSFLRVAHPGAAKTAKEARPRPPCIIVLAQ